MDGSIKDLNLSALVTLCQEENKKFYRKEKSEPKYCYEIFSLAIVKKSEEAWEHIFNIYRTQVLSWVRRNPLSSNFDENSVEHFANGAFARFWSAMNSEKFLEKFTTLAGLLAYLKACVHSEINDYGRKQKKSALELDIDETKSDISTSSISDREVEGKISRELDAAALISELHKLTNSPKEFRVVYYSYVCGLKPREICELPHETFKNTAEVSKIKDTFLKRIRRNDQFKGFLGKYDD